jgi:membrane-associated protease RseP (regulator of RpoE activity)
MTLPEQDILNSFVRRFFRIDDLTLGDAASEFLVRYRGQLLADSIEAFDQLTALLRPYNLMPVFRKDENGGHIILIVPGLPDPKPSNMWVNIVLFLLTVVSVVWTGMGYVDPEKLAGATSDLQKFWLSLLDGGIPFAVSLLGILLAHEFGHYLMSRHHKTAATLPYFIPFPSLLGTMGAVIVWKQLPRNKRILFDVGVAGPLAGLVVAIPVVLYGLFVSKTGPILPAPGGFIEGNSILYLLSKYIVFGQLLPAPASYGNVSPFLYWIKYFFTGLPSPIGGTDVFISPIAMAGWAGLLVTALNLVPAGQFDGGHVMYVLFGKKLKYALPVIIVLMGIMGFFWNGWWLWMALIYFFGRQSADPLDQITELDPGRRALAYFMIFVFILVFMPVPLMPLG